MAAMDAAFCAGLKRHPAARRTHGARNPPSAVRLASPAPQVKPTARAGVVRALTIGAPTCNSRRRCSAPEDPHGGVVTLGAASFDESTSHSSTAAQLHE